MENENKGLFEEENQISDAPDTDAVASDANALSEEDARELARLESLSYESDDTVSIHLTPEENEEFESFLADYHALIASRLSSAKETEDGIVPTPKDSDAKEATIAVEADIMDSVAKEKAVEPKAPIREEKEASDEEWHDEITLSPEVYEELTDEAEYLLDEPIPEEDTEYNIEIGELSDEDDFQISINFDIDAAERSEKSDESSDEWKYDPEKPKFIDSVFDLVELLIFTLVAVMIFTTFLFKHSVVDGDSMLNTLEDGDHLIISDVFYTPERGDLIVFEDYSTSLKKPVIKRVIGLPGETVEVKRNSDGVYEVFIDGEFLPEEYARNVIDSSVPGEGIWVVPEGEVFVLGDNRYNSTDSRSSSVGTIDIDCIIGKVLLRFYPFDKFGTDFN